MGQTTSDGSPKCSTSRLHDEPFTFALFTGDITTLNADVIVCPGNHTMTKGFGISERIFTAAGSAIESVCRRLSPCGTGQIRISGSFHLPCKAIFHTVGPLVAAQEAPTAEQKMSLKTCYMNALDTAIEKGYSTIAFPAILSEYDPSPMQASARVAW